MIIAVNSGYAQDKIMENIFAQQVFVTVREKTEVRHALDFVSINFALSWETQVPWKTICDLLFLEVTFRLRGAFPTEGERSEDSCSLFSRHCHELFVRPVLLKLAKP